MIIACILTIDAQLNALVRDNKFVITNAAIMIHIIALGVYNKIGFTKR